MSHRSSSDCLGKAELVPCTGKNADITFSSLPAAVALWLLLLPYSPGDSSVTSYCQQGLCLDTFWYQRAVSL